MDRKEDHLKIDDKPKISLDIDCEAVTQKILSFIKKVVKDAKSDGVVVGLSGGVDSSLVAYLCVRALDKENVFGLVLPYEGVNPSTDSEHGKLIAEKLGIKCKTLAINRIIDTIVSEFEQNKSDRIIVGNLKARIRMALLYYYANKMGRIVAGTGNKSEDLVGYFTKYGDGGVDLLPISDLYKTQVWELSRYLDVPMEIIEKAPSAGLWENQKDEDELGMDYITLDNILIRIFEEGMSKEETVSELSLDEKSIDEIIERFRRNKHKITPIPSVRINIKTIEEICETF